VDAFALNHDQKSLFVMLNVCGCGLYFYWFLLKTSFGVFLSRLVYVGSPRTRHNSSVFHPIHCGNAGAFLKCVIRMAETRFIDPFLSLLVMMIVRPIYHVQPLAS